MPPVNQTTQSPIAHAARFWVPICAAALALVSGTGAQSSRETLLSTENAYNPIPSPNGQYIGYVRTGWGERGEVSMGRSSLVSDVKIMPAKGMGDPRTLASDYFLSGWTPDSSRVVCYRDWKYAIVSTDGEKAMKGRIATDEQQFQYASEWVGFSSALNTVVWSRWIRKSYRVIETPKAPLASDGETWGERVIPSPDGKYLAVFSEAAWEDPHLRIYDTRGKSWNDLGPMKIHPDKNWWYIQPHWSPWLAGEIAAGFSQRLHADHDES